MSATTQGTVLSALKRAYFEAEAIGDKIAMAPDDVMTLLVRASAIQDRAELERLFSGAEARIVSRCTVFAVSWAYSKSIGETANIQAISSIRNAVRRTDTIIRRSAHELIIFAAGLTDGEAAAAVAERIARKAPDQARIGYVRIIHPMRTKMAIRGADEAWRAASGAAPIREARPAA